MKGIRATLQCLTRISESVCCSQLLSLHLQNPSIWLSKPSSLPGNAAAHLEKLNSEGLLVSAAWLSILLPLASIVHSLLHRPCFAHCLGAHSAEGIMMRREGIYIRLLLQWSVSCSCKLSLHWQRTRLWKPVFPVCSSIQIRPIPIQRSNDMLARTMRHSTSS